MNKDYVIVNIKTNGEFDREDNTQITLIEVVKLNNDLKVLDKIEISNKTNEKDIIIEFIHFCTNSNLITYNSKYTLSFILKALYKNKITDNIRFKYIDLKDVIEEPQDEPPPDTEELTLSNIVCTSAQSDISLNSGLQNN